MAWLTIIVYLSLFVSSNGVLDDLPNLYDVAANLGCDRFLKLTEDAGMAGILNGTGPMTVFAPTNNAIQSLPRDVLARLSSDKDLLKAVLSYHFTTDVFNSTTSINEMLIPSEQGANIRINAYPQQNDIVITASGGEIILKNVQAKNGVLQVISKVMFPLPNGTIFELVNNDLHLSTLFLTIIKASLGWTLSADPPLTLLAPTDGAFSNLPAGTLTTLLNDIPKLTDLLLFHVVGGTYYSAGLVNNTSVTALNKGTLNIKISPENNIFVNDAMVTTADVSVTNGVVHYIDKVLIPPSFYH
ncbi:transforming growth factor-beta-induced protein ig-h3 [Patella vulgata]|uniref:transforming growth factor-beta-induced protein ig-h3 n=1 Tax=Patella vulgata TaxID=6465 RepID=UPI0021807999|nr:transforming growth factor-beta-induced protein ig-h3 [Patella vulgata]